MHSVLKFDLQFNAALKRACMLLGAALLVTIQGNAAGAEKGEIPSTFGTTIGSGLLCVDQIDPFYYWSYMNQFFGPPYKREGGAYWFKVTATLWGATITDVLVSDGDNQQVFLAASFKDSPAKLADAISASTGIRHVNEESFKFSPLRSSVGSKIIYFDKNSKIYCAKYNPDYMRQQLH